MSYLTTWIKDLLKNNVEKTQSSSANKEALLWTDKFIKKYKPALKELAKK